MQHTWAWTLAGLICLGLEVLLGVPVVLLFFALACFVTAIAAATGVVVQWPFEALLAAVTATGSLVVGRRRLLGITRRMGVGTAALLGEPLGALGLTLDAAAPGASLRVELFGVPWRGNNVATVALDKGRGCKVVAVRGLTLDVVPSDPPAPAPTHHKHPGQAS